MTNQSQSTLFHIAKSQIINTALIKLNSLNIDVVDVNYDDQSIHIDTPKDTSEFQRVHAVDKIITQGNIDGVTVKWATKPRVEVRNGQA